MNENVLSKFPELNNPPCLRKTKYGNYICGFCTLAKSIAAGTTYVLNGKRLTTEEAIRHNLNLCMSNWLTKTTEERATVKEIRREGQRILKAGTNIRVQLKRKAGTKRSVGFVVECYEDNYVKIFIHDLGFKTVLADEFVTARKGTTKLPS